jgi:hypothetical protein
MNNVARRAIACGLKRGNIVALSTDQPLMEATLILGLTQAGMIPVSVGILPPAELKIDAVIGATKPQFAPTAQHLPLDDSWSGTSVCHAALQILRPPSRFGWSDPLPMANATCVR